MKVCAVLAVAIGIGGCIGGQFIEERDSMGREESDSRDSEYSENSEMAGGKCRSNSDCGASDEDQCKEYCNKERGECNVNAEYATNGRACFGAMGEGECCYGVCVVPGKSCGK